MLFIYNLCILHLHNREAISENNTFTKTKPENQKNMKKLLRIALLLISS